MILFSPKREIRVQALEGIRLLSLSYCEKGQAVTYLKDIPGDTILKPTLLYSVTVFEDNMITKLNDYANPDFHTDMNTIQDIGLHIIRADDTYNLNANMWSQFKLKSVKGFYGGEKWCKDNLPWMNTLNKVEKNGIYLIQVIEINGKTIPAGVELDGVKLLHQDSIEGVLLEDGDSVCGITYLPENAKFKMRLEPLSVISSIDDITTSVEIDDESIMITIHPEYVGKPFRIIGTQTNKIYSGKLSDKPLTDVSDYTEPDIKITYKPRETNELYKVNTMFCYCADKLMHIHYSRNYIGDKFYISYKDKTFYGIFDEHSHLIDTAIVLKENR